MKAGKFFRHVWRVNSILILFVGLLAVVTMGFAVFGMYRSSVQSQGTAVDVRTDVENSIRTKLRLGESREIAGRPCVMIPLNLSGASSKTYWAKSGTRTRNYLFVNTHDLSRNWLFPDNKALIKRYDFLIPENKRCEDRIVVGILYQVFRSDSNKDGKLGHADKISLYVSDPNGSNLKEIVPAADQVMGHRLVDDDLLFLTYGNADAAYVLKCSLKDPAIRETAEVSITP